jgi:NADH-quinone oxidoreductase subunit C/D
MPAGPYKADHPLTCAAAQGTHPAAHRNPDHALPERVVGPGDAAGESSQLIEATKGINSYYLTSRRQSTMSYRTRIRTPSFPHLQQIPAVIRGSMIPDLIAYIASPLTL